MRDQPVTKPLFYGNTTHSAQTFVLEVGFKPWAFYFGEHV
jgi:hypothetical protein